MSDSKKDELRAFYRLLEAREAKLPFVGPSQDRSHPHYWHVPLCRDFSEAYSLGERHGRALVDLFRQHPDHAGHGLLSRIVHDMNLFDFSPQRGTWAGFFDHLEVLIAVSIRMHESDAEAQAGPS
ncbi:hypothetical protein HNO92_003894 [Chromobacterium alkanivorans]|uniref:hypothetical protein n=1 Tax=Chromobacterium alkanivorans TaxID=1071719 RepID=UPI002168DCB8|nr:hypothetical protein [Chromobacterium alkanivorans]MCS3803970.1 hypothetical protein [Chromobacterium alkanivorans]MCS3817925.1 hypothetical protein [Chromobacterium alkanivorans]MCS3875545.1 hypothetical protein [Chromobacterium alkanivorans]